MTAFARLRDSMMAAGLDPVPLELARAAGISPEEAERVFACVEKVPEDFMLLAKACRVLKIRLSWVIAGIGVPNADHSLITEEAEALDLLAQMTPEEQRRWLRYGARLKEK